MRLLLKAIIYVIYGLYSLVCVFMNSLLLLCIHRHNPPFFKNFGIFIKLHSIFNLIGSFTSAFTMQRIIPAGMALLYVSYGPCTLTGSWSCYIGYAITLFGYIINFYITLVCFISRMHIVVDGTISYKRAMTYLYCITLPVPCIFMVTFLMSKTDDDVMVGILNATYPHYYEDGLTISGNETILTIPMMIVMIIVVGLILPVFIVMIVFRQITLFRVRKSKNSVTIKTRGKQKELLTMLTLQACLPFVQILAVVTFLLGYFNIVNHPLLESISIILAETPSLFSPIITFRYVPSYRKEARRIFGIPKPKKKGEKASNSNSSSQGARITAPTASTTLL